MRNREEPSDAEASLLTRGLREGWGHWAGSEKSAAEIANWHVDRLYGPLKPIIEGLERKGFIEKRAGGVGLTLAGYEAAKRAEGTLLARNAEETPELSATGPEWFPYQDQVRNPRRIPWDADVQFQEFVRKDAARNAGLLAELLNRMNAILEDPLDYGQPYRYAGAVVRDCRYHHNGRIRWRVNQDGDEISVVFQDVKSREDKSYSPRQR